jgi:hypothetical protein
MLKRSVQDVAVLRNDQNQIVRSPRLYPRFDGDPGRQLGRKYRSLLPPMIDIDPYVLGRHVPPSEDSLVVEGLLLNIDGHVP